MLLYLGYLLIFLISLKIALVDIKTHLIKNIDLLLLLLLVLIFLDVNLRMGLANFLIHLLVYQGTRKKLGFGDVKLSFVIGLSFSDIHLLLVALNASWIMGGLWALLSRHSKIAFAPWMLTGAVITQILIK